MSSLHCSRCLFIAIFIPSSFLRFMQARIALCPLMARNTTSSLNMLLIRLRGMWRRSTWQYWGRHSLPQARPRIPWGSASTSAKDSGCPAFASASAANRFCSKEWKSFGVIRLMAHWAAKTSFTLRISQISSTSSHLISLTRYPTLGIDCKIPRFQEYEGLLSVEFSNSLSPWRSLSLLVAR